MIQAILGLINTIFGFVGSLLPDSPFADLVTTNEQIALGISWLNWLFPISDMLALMALWIAACVVVCAVRTAIEVTGSIGGKVVGGS